MVLLTGCGGQRTSREVSDSSTLAEDPQRKVIYEAEISLIVKDVSAIEEELPKLVKRAGGFLADILVNRNQGEQRSGRWQARIPVDQFDSFLQSASELGIPEHRRQTIQDVTEEFVDYEARIANKKRLESRIVELLKNSSGKIEDVIEVERELARVRSEIEQMEGRLRYLNNRVQLTTITILAREIHEYAPPEAPGFVDQIGQAWNDSLRLLKEVGQSIAVAVVFSVPWLLGLGVVLTPLIWFVRRHNRSVTRVSNSERHEGEAD